MSWLVRLLRPLARLFRRAPPKPSPLDLTPAAPEREALSVAPEPRPERVPESAAALVPSPPEFPPLPEGAATVEVEEGEEQFEEEELAEDALAASEAALDARPDLDVIVAERHARLDDDRREAEAQALSGERRVRLTDPAGPGTLAETLARLEREGRVTSRLDEDEGGPVLVYAPFPSADGGRAGDGGEPQAHPPPE